LLLSDGATNETDEYEDTDSRFQRLTLLTGSLEDRSESHQLTFVLLRIKHYMA